MLHKSVNNSTTDDQVWEIANVTNWCWAEQQLFCLFHLGKGEVMLNCVFRIGTSVYKK